MSRSRSKAPVVDHHVYVIELHPSVYEADPKFRHANPDWDPRKPCVYVGMTSKTPEERFAQHLSGRLAGRNVKEYGVRLRPKIYARYNPLTRADAKKLEELLAIRLRKKGYATWQR